ncbi:helix-turn-helix transcriptional regulator [Megasphaera sp.]|uniref:ArsR/SmtB family transcription factor n=1 Tax=Megasphaera sp. TaxID=2023260 RepID=UPI0025FA600C|nr:metalloregulator ArsR/SmtB family transcription factor [uncultured Megasphaera sp.]
MKPQALALSKEYIQPLADVFKVLGDPTRLRILRLLMKGEVCVRDIAEDLGMGQSAVSHQLRILRDARLVQFRRDGKTVYYSLADAHVFTLLDVGLEHVAE